MAANYNYIWQGAGVFPSSGVSTQVQFDQHHVQPRPQIQISHPSSSHSQPAINQAATRLHGSINLGSDFYLKVLNPENKREYKTVTLRGLSRENIDTPTKLKEVISVQCDGLNPENMEVGYFVHSKKLWINSRLDISDVWNSVDKGEKLTLWCLGTTPRETLKRKCDDQASDDVGPPTKRHASQGPSSVEVRKAKAREYELKLLELHKDKWTSFQYKLWAEMLACGTHTSISDPPSASMFGRESKRSSTSSSAINDSVVSGMVTVMNTLCQALVPKQAVTGSSSPMKRLSLEEHT